MIENGVRRCPPTYVCPGCVVRDGRAHAANTWPQPGAWRWVGFVRERGGLWVPMAEADSVEAVWEALDTTWVHGDRFVMPVRRGNDGD